MRNHGGRQRPDDQAFAGGSIALVEDDDGLRARRLGVDRSLREGAGPALDQRDVVRPGEVEAGEVRSLAAACRRSRRCEVDVDRNDGPRDISDATTCERAGLIRGPDGRQLLEHGGEDEVELELELVRAHRCFRDSSG